MSARPGRFQSAFTAGELALDLHERTSLKYFSAGLAHMANFETVPQGGFRLTDGLRHVGALSADAARLFNFTSSAGLSYDLVFRPGGFGAWDKTSLLATVNVAAASGGVLPEINTAQQRDVMFLFHRDMRSKRIKHLAADDWQVDDLPYAHIFTYDYGGPVGGGVYTNGVPAQWEIEFIGVKGGTSTGTATSLYVTVNGENTSTITYSGSMAGLCADVQAAIDALSTAASVTATDTSGAVQSMRVTFDLEGGATPPATLSITILATAATVHVVRFQDYIAGTQPAIFDIEFFDLVEVDVDGGTVFTLTVANQETYSLQVTRGFTGMDVAMRDAILDLPNVRPGITVEKIATKKFLVTFSGAGNEGDGWAVSGRAINKADAAILASKTRPGVEPGEPVISDDRGWPSCGTFYGQRLIVGGFASLPNAWAMSMTGDYYEFDNRFQAADGPALIPMDAPGGERIERIVAGQNLLFFTTNAEYWLAERKLVKTEAPNHVQASTNGVRPGAPIVSSEGSALYVQKLGGVLSEFRYRDVEGNYNSQDISLLASHLVTGASDIAVRKAVASSDGNLLHIVNGDGSARNVVMLRDQEVTAFCRRETAGLFRAVCVNGRNETSYIVERAAGRALERTEPGCLLDQAIFFTHGSPSPVVTGLARLNGLEAWCIADGHVFGPFTPASGQIALPIAVSSGYVGTWTPPLARSLPLPRDIGPNIVLKKRARIHTVILSVIDSTSLAIGVNGQRARDVALRKWGDMADTAELALGYTGQVKVSGLTGYLDDPYVEITQLRPGRLSVRSMTVEADL